MSLDIWIDNIFKVFLLTHPRPLSASKSNAWFACLKGLAGASQYADKETVLGIKFRFELRTFDVSGGRVVSSF